MNKPYFWASSFLHYKGGSDILEVMTWVKERDIASYGRYAPKSRAKKTKVRDWEIEMNVWSLDIPDGTKFRFNESGPMVEGAKHIATASY